jgi:hypothetical protein
MDLTTLLDKRNAELFEEVSKKCKITFEYSSENNYACYSEGQSSIIYVPKYNQSIESLTHELLHIYLRTKEMYAGGCLTRMINESKELEQLFDKELIDHITNVIDHIKMFPIFISLGFDKEKFIDDFNTPKCTEEEIKRLELYHSVLPNFKPDFFKLFVGKFFSMKGCPNDKYNYEICYKKMDDLDFILLQDLNSFNDEWQSYDINKNDIFDKHYREIMSELVVSFKAWNRTN